MVNAYRFNGIFSQPSLSKDLLQNWQSEFMSTGVLIVPSSLLREKSSLESRPVGAPHEQTGKLVPADG